MCACVCVCICLFEKGEGVSENQASCLGLRRKGRLAAARSRPRSRPLPPALPPDDQKHQPTKTLTLILEDRPEDGGGGGLGGVIGLRPRQPGAGRQARGVGPALRVAADTDADGAVLRLRGDCWFLLVLF